KGFSIVYKTDGLPAPKELAKYGERWQPYRTVASWYLWQALGLPKDALPRRRTEMRPATKSR
ncbi:MAG TPA: hypothetical protein VNI02_12725, partial [Blastocatellia bacterium]|nr:hypothetical protein [Blastocatellia bacterium]